MSQAKPKTLSPCGTMIESIQTGELVEVVNQDRHHKANETYFAARVTIKTRGRVARNVPILLTRFQVRRALQRASKPDNLMDVPPAKRKGLMERAAKAWQILKG